MNKLRIISIALGVVFSISQENALSMTPSHESECMRSYITALGELSEAAGPKSVSFATALDGCITALGSLVQQWPQPSDSFEQGICDATALDISDDTDWSATSPQLAIAKLNNALASFTQLMDNMAQSLAPEQLSPDSLSSLLQPTDINDILSEILANKSSLSKDKAPDTTEGEHVK